MRASQKSGSRVVGGPGSLVGRFNWEVVRKSRQDGGSGSGVTGSGSGKE